MFSCTCFLFFSLYLFSLQKYQNVFLNSLVMHKLTDYHSNKDMFFVVLYMRTNDGEEQRNGSSLSNVSISFQYPYKPDQHNFEDKGTASIYLLVKYQAISSRFQFNLTKKRCNKSTPNVLDSTYSYKSKLIIKKCSWLFLPRNPNINQQSFLWLPTRIKKKNILNPRYGEDQIYKKN